MKRAEVVRASGLNGTVVYDIFAGKSRPGRDHAIMLALGMRCTLRETQRLLRLSGVSELWPKVRRDAIIIWCIDHGFDRSATDDELWSLGEQTLFHTGPYVLVRPVVIRSGSRPRSPSDFSVAN